MYVASSRMIDSPKYIEFFSIMKSQIASRMCKSNVTDHSLGPTSLDEARVIWCTPYSDYLLKRGQGERHKTVFTRKISTRSADDNEPGISNVTTLLKDSFEWYHLSFMQVLSFQSRKMHSGWEKNVGLFSVLSTLLHTQCYSKKFHVVRRKKKSP